MVKFSHLSLCILLALVKDVRMQFDYLGVVDCSYLVKDSKCEKREACTVTCSSACSSPGDKIKMWGTRWYTSDTPLCRSAVHDYRIPVYESDNKYNITFKRNNTFSKYIPSIQQGIVTKFYEKEDEFYRFLSPQIKEAILDVTVLSFTNLYPENGVFRQECSIYDRSRTNGDLDFEFYFPETEKQKGVQNEAGWKEVSWTGQQLNPGGYWCHVTRNTYSHVMSLTMREDADFIPDQWTLTVSYDQDVVIRFTPRPSVTTEMGVTWKKDQNILHTFPNMKLSHDQHGHYLLINKLDDGDGGVYSLELDGKPEKRGIMRLIVRRCSQGYFGDCCAEQCPECQNGGMCHEATGTCICAPGFGGPYCEEKCQKGCFGQSCTQCCDMSMGTKDGSCRGALICQPDPYGCSCAPGYTGLKCDKHRGRYRRHAGKVADPFKNKSNTQTDRLSNLDNRSHQIIPRGRD